MKEGLNVTSVATAWGRPLYTLRAVLIGLAVTGVGTVPWVIFSLVNVRTSSHVPWAGPLTAVWLWAYWRYLSGHGPPRATAELRRERLQIRPLAARIWGWALLATISAFTALITLSLAARRVLPILRRAEVSDLDRYPLALVLTGLVMTAVVAAVTEEAGFRGYMQSALDRQLGTVVSTALVAMVFSLIHLSHGLAVERLVINAAASVVLSLTSRRTGSIRPGIVVHAASDMLVPLYAWAHRGTAASHAAPPPGPDAPFVAQCAIAVALVAFSVWCYARLANVTRGEAGIGSSAGPAAR
jgi:membrane protease YdiL (CAAX protease family)